MIHGMVLIRVASWNEFSFHLTHSVEAPIAPRKELPTGSDHCEMLNLNAAEPENLPDMCASFDIDAEQNYALCLFFNLTVRCRTM